MPDPTSVAAKHDAVSSDAQAVSSPEPVNGLPPVSSPGIEVLQTPLDASDQLSATDQDPQMLWLRRGDQIVVWLLMAALLGLLTLHWLRLSRWGSMPVELSSQQPREYFYSLEINSASWVEWAQLEGIGEKLARRIVADRDENGPFRSINDVGRVRGIGPKVLEKLKPYLRVETASGDQRPSHD